VRFQFSIRTDTLGQVAIHKEPCMNTQPALPRMALSVSEFCSCYSIGRSTFYEEVKAGRLKVRKAGARTLIASADAERWLESLRKP